MAAAARSRSASSRAALAAASSSSRAEFDALDGFCPPVGPTLPAELAFAVSGESDWVAFAFEATPSGGAIAGADADAVPRFGAIAGAGGTAGTVDVLDFVASEAVDEEAPVSDAFCVRCVQYQ